VEILGEATVRNRLPKQLQGLALPELSKQGVSVAMFLAPPPADALSDPGRATKSAGLFVSFTLPGTKTSWVTVLGPPRPQRCSDAGIWNAQRARSSLPP
jgi:hypothetical protein